MNAGDMSPDSVNARQLSEDQKDYLCREWRELRFYYFFYRSKNAWILEGSQAGLLNFVYLVRAYTLNPRHQQIGEHTHLGPYLSLTIGTAPKPEINDHWIAGPLPDLARLSKIFEERLLAASPGDRFSLRDEFAPDSACDLVFQIHDYNFDPALLDPNI
ncbi:MAG: hypothetical protein U0903_04860 [Planctomycetales bacterium]